MLSHRAHGHPPGQLVKVLVVEPLLSKQQRPEVVRGRGKAGEELAHLGHNAAAILWVCLINLLMHLCPELKPVLDWVTHLAPELGSQLLKDKQVELICLNVEDPVTKRQGRMVAVNAAGDSVEELSKLRVVNL